jgi:TATA-box binding protein (TBP) (component of TFIID and TFIIIB)
MELLRQQLAVSRKQQEMTKQRKQKRKKKRNDDAEDDHVEVDDELLDFVCTTGESILKQTLASIKEDVLATEESGYSLEASNSTTRCAHAAKILQDPALRDLFVGNESRIDVDKIARESLRFTDRIGLGGFRGVLSLVPDAVNLVSLARLWPIRKDGSKVPAGRDGKLHVFDLPKLALLLPCSAYNPRRFAALQVSFACQPKTRLLVFSTGRIVSTGSLSEEGARAAILRFMLTVERLTGQRLFVLQSNVVNVVSALRLPGRLDLHSFSRRHTGDSFFDSNGFVGAAFRPVGSNGTSFELYSSGRTNLPGSTRVHATVSGFRFVLRELLAHTTATDVLERFEQRQKTHPPLKKIDEYVPFLNSEHLRKKEERRRAVLSKEPQRACGQILGKLQQKRAELAGTVSSQQRFAEDAFQRRKRAFEEYQRAEQIRRSDAWQTLDLGVFGNDNGLTEAKRARLSEVVASVIRRK